MICERKGRSSFKIAARVSAEVGFWNTPLPESISFQDRAETEQIGAMIRDLPLRLFWRHVTNGTQEQPPFSLRR